MNHESDEIKKAHKFLTEGSEGRKMMTVEIKQRFNLELIISLVIVMATIIGTTVPLYIHSSNQITAISIEMKDFHARLCVIEERNRK